MAVLTVSREIGSGGDAIAKKVAEKCGWDLLDNEGFAAAAQTYGYVRAELEKVDERGPGLIERFFRDRQLVYLDIMRAIVFESAIKNNIVILGRGSGILLKGIPGVFRVRFIASDKVRQRRLVDQEGISVSMAEEFIRHNDQERLSYTRYFFDAMWGYPSNYDVVMNTGQMSEEKRRSPHHFLHQELQIRQRKPRLVGDIEKSRLRPEDQGPPDDGRAD